MKLAGISLYRHVQTVCEFGRSVLLRHYLVLRAGIDGNSVKSNFWF